MISKIPSLHERRMTGFELSKMAYDIRRFTTGASTGFLVL
jgi:hypothetical protein